MNDLLNNLFWILIFPGFVFTVTCGLLAGWVVRKVTALVHHRIGPPLLQQGYDVMKLLGKETLIPEAAQKVVFIAAPLAGMSGALVLATLLWRNNFATNIPYLGDVIVALYLMAIPSLALILGSSASASPHAAIGASREIKLVISYELALVLALIIVIIKAVGNSKVTGSPLYLSSLAAVTPVFSISGMLAFLVAILCVQAKLGYVPFDAAEAETEIAGGILIEYSGALLAIWQLMQTILLIAFPLFLVTVFMGGFDAGTVSALLLSIGKYVLVLVLLILIKNTNPRMRIDQVMKFFWYYCGPVLGFAIVLAMLGNAYGLGWL
ncbi:MAG: NADH-quinone oxidoreductase subunit H [Sedimentisphaerales bacterium]|nr:NADH-quinone oxidoreductase subunit H [Sedimentisphaerales bacterium]